MIISNSHFKKVLGTGSLPPYGYLKQRPAVENIMNWTLNMFSIEYRELLRQERKLNHGNQVRICTSASNLDSSICVRLNKTMLTRSSSLKGGTAQGVGGSMLERVLCTMDDSIENILIEPSADANIRRPFFSSTTRPLIVPENQDKK